MRQTLYIPRYSYLHGLLLVIYPCYYQCSRALKESRVCICHRIGFNKGETSLPVRILKITFLHWTDPNIKAHLYIITALPTPKKEAKTHINNFPTHPNPNSGSAASTPVIHPFPSIYSQTLSPPRGPDNPIPSSLHLTAGGHLAHTLPRV